MLIKKSFWIGIAMILVCAILSFCSPTPDKVSPEPPKDVRCGDDICDDVEQKNPSLCPEDCTSPQADSGGVGSIPEEDEDAEPPKERDPNTGKDDGKCVPRKWWFTFDGCGSIVGTEPNYNMCVEVEACISVDENCRIQGTGSGTHTTCEYTGNCTYEVQCSDFSMPISGEAELFKIGAEWPSGQIVEQEGSHLLKIKVDSKGIYEDVVAHCPGASVDLKEPAALQTVFGSVARNNDGYFIFIEVSEPQDVEMGYGQSVRGEDALWPGLSYEFFTSISPDNYCK